MASAYVLILIPAGLGLGATHSAANRFSERWRSMTDEPQSHPTQITLQAGLWGSSSTSGSCLPLMGQWSGRLAGKSEQRGRYCIRSTAPLWRKDIWAERKNSWSTGQFLLLPSPMVITAGSWPKELDTSGRNWFSQESGCCVPYRQGDKSSYSWGTLRRAAAPLLWKEPVEMVWASGKDAPWASRSPGTSYFEKGCAWFCYVG